MNATGIYYGRIVGSGIEEVGDNRTPAFYLTFNVTHEQEGAEWKKINPFVRDVRLFLSEKAFDYSVEKLKNLGFSGDFANPNFEKEGAELECSHKSHEGKTYEQWNIAGTFQKKQASADIVRTLAAKYKSAVGPTSTPPKPPTPPAVRAASVDDPNQPPF